jgi:hypothetical protein
MRIPLLKNENPYQLATNLRDAVLSRKRKMQICGDILYIYEYFHYINLIIATCSSRDKKQHINYNR